MDDLIKRQDAIDYCYQLINVEHEQGSDEMNYGQERVNQTETILHHLEFMPSAEPVIRCKDCKHRIVNEHYGEKGYMDLKAMCDLDTDDIFQLGRNAENDDWFCADGERKADG